VEKTRSPSRDCFWRGNVGGNWRGAELACGFYKARVFYRYKYWSCKWKYLIVFSSNRQQPLTAIAKFSVNCTFNFLNSFFGNGKNSFQ